MSVVLPSQLFERECFFAMDFVANDCLITLLEAFLRQKLGLYC
jgi:hypothetical protein